MKLAFSYVGPADLLECYRGQPFLIIGVYMKIETYIGFLVGTLVGNWLFVPLFVERTFEYGFLVGCIACAIFAISAFPFLDKD